MCFPPSPPPLLPNEGGHPPPAFIAHSCTILIFTKGSLFHCFKAHSLPSLGQFLPPCPLPIPNKDMLVLHNCFPNTSLPNEKDTLLLPLHHTFVLFSYSPMVHIFTHPWAGQFLSPPKKFWFYTTSYICLSGTLCSTVVSWIYKRHQIRATRVIYHFIVLRCCSSPMLQIRLHSN